ncbi:hypothetical protein BHE74_00020545 [Ensete ventricosum]|nr:hypothetical protein BHE74_00020545 [Ensete ventricosum]RZS07585.1 hypothetical protein BHM03_00038444 [Ensete ventricosum]
MHRVDAVGNSLGVRRELAEGIESLPGWRKGVRQKKSRLAGRLSGVTKKRFIEGIRKLAGSTLGDHRKKTGWLAARIPEVTGLAKVGS